MSDELLIAGKTFVTSKHAALVTGYAQDYIGQLSRGGLIDAQRVGGLWYVQLDSLRGYKSTASEFKPQQPTAVPVSDPETVVSFDGQDYISASRAAKITGYNQDYIGQLARTGKILSRQIGNRWYVERSGLLAHKSEKDRLLGAVQAESVGLARRTSTNATSDTESHQGPYTGEYAGSGPVLTYFQDDRALLPALSKSEEVAAPIRIVRMHAAPPSTSRAARAQRLPAVRGDKRSSMLSGKAISRATKSLSALTIVVVLSYGLFSLKDGSRYAQLVPKSPEILQSSEYLAAASESFERAASFLEQLVTKEIVYMRSFGN
jgi:hypothetical protein